MFPVWCMKNKHALAIPVSDGQSHFLLTYLVSMVNLYLIFICKIISKEQILESQDNNIGSIFKDQMKVYKKLLKEANKK